jgi:DNA-directed RNA polymerase sigma subunit (sigma70/sigma32)
MTLKAIGAQIGLTRERVRQLEGEALRKLQRAITEAQ